MSTTSDPRDDGAKRTPDELTRVTNLNQPSAADAPAKAPQAAGPDPAKPAASGEQPTIVTNLNKPVVHREATMLTRLNQPDPDVTKITDAQGPAKAGGTSRPGPGGTVITDLNVEASGDGTRAGKSTDVGTHRDQIWGDFRIGELLGKGGMGSVYRGRQVSLDRPVAIKVLPKHLSENENFRQRFALEAKAVAQISSPHVIQVYAAGQHEGHHYFAMEFVEGNDLSRQLKDGYKPSYRQALDLVIQAARGLAAAGELGIVHRDIKPANMMVTKKGLLKLMDFGLVKLAASSEHGLTMAGTIMGTVSYFSPEQGRGENCDQRTDIYALGVVFYEILTSKLPFAGADATSVIYQHIHSVPRKPKELDPNIPEDYQAVVLKCMQKLPEHRYQTAAALLADLESLREGRHPETAFMDPDALRFGATLVKTGAFKAPAAKSKAGLVAVIAVVAVLAIGGGLAAANPQWFAAKPPDRRPPPPDHAVVPQGDSGVEELGKIRALVSGGEIAEARRRFDLASPPHAGDAQWSALGKELDQVQGQRELKAAQQALAAKDFEGAGKSAAAAQSLIPGNPELKQVVDALTSHEGAKRQQTRVLAEANTLLNDGNYQKAEEVLVRLQTEMPGDQDVAGALNRARKMRDDAESDQKALREQIEKGNSAFEHHDFEAAILAFTAARQRDPKNVSAADGLERVTRIKETISGIRDRFRQALTDRNLPEAEKQLAELRSAASGNAVVVQAEKDLASSRLREDLDAKAKAEAEAKVVAKAKAVSELIADPKQDLPALEQALAAFIAEAGADRSERPALEQKLEDRRQLKRVGDTIAGLDAAVAAKDAAKIKAVVLDAEFATALTELMALKGLIFAEQIDGFSRQDKLAKLSVTLRQAAAEVPESKLKYQYDLRQDAQGWVITAAHPQAP